MVNNTTPDNIIVNTKEIYEEILYKQNQAAGFTDTITIKGNVLRTAYVRFLIEYIEQQHPDWKRK
jgi:hypothetical protein